LCNFFTCKINQYGFITFYLPAGVEVNSIVIVLIELVGDVGNVVDIVDAIFKEL
jgi:hypothetical protein